MPFIPYHTIYSLNSRISLLLSDRLHMYIFTYVIHKQFHSLLSSSCVWISHQHDFYAFFHFSFAFYIFLLFLMSVPVAITKSIFFLHKYTPIHPLRTYSIPLCFTKKAASLKCIECNCLKFSLTAYHTSLLLLYVNV